MNDSQMRVPIQLTRGCLVASIQVEFGADMLRSFRDDLLGRIRDTGTRGVILDVSGVEVMDVVEFESLRRTMDMAALMGATPVIVGLRAGIVSALVDLDADTDSIRATFDLDQAFDLLAPRDPVSPTDDNGPDTGPDTGDDDAHTHQC